MALPAEFRIKTDGSSPFSDEELASLPRKQRILEQELGGTKWPARKLRSLVADSGLTPDEVREYCERSSHIARSPKEDDEGNEFYGHIVRLRENYEVSDSGDVSRKVYVPLEQGPAVVFLVHGRDIGAREQVARFLEKAGQHEILILDEQASRGRTLIEKFEAHAENAKYAVVLLTGDDVGRSQDETDCRSRARQNVVFELGFFFGKLGRENVAVLYATDVEKPSDVEGLVYVPFEGNWRERVIRELRDAGLDFSLDRLA